MRLTWRLWRPTRRSLMPKVLALAQCFAIMPLRGVRSRDVADLRFTWRSFRTLYAGVLFVLTCLNAVLTVLHMYTGPIEFERLGE